MNFFSKKEAVSPLLESDLMEVVEKGYPKIVHEIHHEFMNAGDKLLKTANDILDTLSISNQDKVTKLKQFGFTQTKQVTETAETQKKINEQKKISEAISAFRVEYPNYKYITIEIAEKICAKYNLVLGAVGRFKGFVPQKNVDDIDRFFSEHPKDATVYIEKRYSKSIYLKDEIRFITEDEYNAAKERKKNVYTLGIDTQSSSQYNLESAALQAAMSRSHHMDPTYSKEPAYMAICAPLKDMDMQGMKLEGVHMVKDVPVPDPVVLLPKNHKNGTVGYLILTAWGDESSDPLVVNQNHN